MPIEEAIIKAIKECTFNEKLPEFIDKAKFLEERLKEGQKLFVRIDEWRPVPNIYEYTIYLELHELGKTSRTIIYTDHFGKLKIHKTERDLFEDYKPSLESQRE